MAYSSTYGLTRIAYLGFYQDYTQQGASTAKSFWSYVTADTAATVETAAYFNSAYQQLQVGDTIVAIMVVSGTPVLKHYVVTASSASGVTIALQTTTAG